VGLAISDDGMTFKKFDSNPIIMGMAPEVVRFKGQFYLFFQRLSKNNRMYIYCCPSDDGIRFREENVKMVFTPSDNLNSFEDYSISTVRIWQEKDWFYMTYGGCDCFPDYPAAIGLARSSDLIHWERYPGNPILERGLPGDWDEGAVWFATIYRHEDTYFLWYEGTGTGLTQNNLESNKKSLICRREDYGGYGKFSFSQIGMATFHGKLSSW
jgi:sucrose-6-phosphate hydrolase SacC (GH32 family)